MMRLVIVLSSVLFLAGCPAQAPVSLDRHSEALGLLDRGSEELRGLDLDAAEASFALSLELEGSAAAMDGLGCVSLLRGQLDQAESYFERVRAFDPEYDRVYSNLALLYEIRGNQSKARQLYRRALLRSPGDVGTRNNFAGLLFDRNELKLGRAELLKARAMEKNPIVQNNLSTITRKKR